MIKYKYRFVKLPSVYNLGGFRIGGPGLGNLLFVISRGYVESLKSGHSLYPIPLIQIKPGAIFRREKDFRSYWNIIFRFNSETSFLFFKVCIYLIFGPVILSKVFNFSRKEIVTKEVISGLGGYFNDFIGYDNQVKLMINENIENALKDREYSRDVFSRNIKMNYCVIHIRKGDFVDIWRADDDWYQRGLDFAIKTYGAVDIVYVITDEINKSQEIIKMCTKVFSNIQVFDGDALDCLYLMSKANYVVGNNSTFSAWGAYLGSGKLVSQFVCSFLMPERDSFLKIEIAG